MAGWRFFKLDRRKRIAWGARAGAAPRRARARNGDAMRLRAWDLTVERGGRRVIAGLSFEAGEGSALIVTGPNGAGKTSLLRALAGFLPIESGGFALDGGEAERTVGEQAHYLGHADGVKVALTAGENLAFAAAMLGGDSSRTRSSGACRARPRPCDRFPGAAALGRTEAARGACPPACRKAAALAARRADDCARRRRSSPRSPASCGRISRRRNPRRRRSWRPRTGWRAGAEARRDGGRGGVR